MNLPRERWDVAREAAAAVVLKRGEVAGHLVRDDGGTTFRYDPDHLRRGGPAIATTVPLTADPVRSPSGVVPPFFAGLLPEGRMALDLAGRRREDITRRTFLQAGSAVGVPDRAVTRMLDGCARRWRDGCRSWISYRSTSGASTGCGVWWWTGERSWLRHEQTELK